ncbi:hypothetical protein EHYA_07567 [Embleya hyalina]|uniref:Uncharacterized protein n=1 Tax=Embleya hyalina TaxID=516124 RepID=A0A401YZB9_9ACTN|nr:hypothetical protein EHYA_07567 [Embleya hyalina]
MSDTPSSSHVVSSREWRGNHQTYIASFRQYDFPVTVRKIADEDPQTTDR